MSTLIGKLVRSFLFSFCILVFPQKAFPMDLSTLPPAIRMPRFDSDLQRIEFLQATQKAFPGIFEVAATFDINLLQILKDHQSLVEKLAENPKYVPSFQERKLIRMSIHPQILIRTEGTRITLKALTSWKRQLIDTFGKLNLDFSLASAIFKKMEENLPAIKKKWIYDSEKSTLRAEYAPLLKLGVKKEYRNLFVTKVNAAKEIRSKLAIIHSEIPEYSTQAGTVLNKLEDFNLRYRNYLLADYERANEIEKEQIALAQLYVVLKKKVEYFDHQDDSKKTLGEAKGVVLRLSRDDLAYFSDPDVTDEITAELGTRLKLDGLTERLKFLVNKSIEFFGRQRRTYSAESKEDVHLQEVQPWIGVLRGLIGGDCASRFSFPYPNDPHEHVFLVTNQHGERKGIVSATIVNAVAPDGSLEKALYLITIAGKKIKPGDVELIFRAFEKNKGLFGVVHILLPQKEVIPSLINFSAIQGVYMHHMPNGVTSLVDIRYQDPDLRFTIEEHQSEYNTARYDHMERNQKGFILKLRPEDVNDAVIQTQVKMEDPLNLVSTQLEPHEVIDFLLDQHASNRTEVVDELLKSPAITSTTREQFIQATHFLVNGAVDSVLFLGNPEPYYRQPTGEVLNHPLSVVEFEAKAKTALRTLGLTDTQMAEKQHLFYRGRLRSPDAFLPENVERTSELITRDLELHFDRPRVGWKFIAEHSDQLIHTVGFQPILAKIMKNIQSEDEERAIESSLLLMKFLLPQTQPLGAIQRQAVKVLIGTPLESEDLANLRFKLTHPSAASWTEEKLLLDRQIDRKLRKLDLDGDLVTYVPFILHEPMVFLEHLQKSQTPTNQEEILQIRERILHTTIEFVRAHSKSNEYPMICQIVRYFEVLESMQPPLLVEEKEVLYSYLEQFISEIRGLTNFLEKYDCIQGVKSLEVRMHLTRLHLASLRKFMSERGLRDSKDWFSFAQLLEKAYETPEYHDLYEEFKKKETEFLNQIKLSDNLIQMSEYLEGPGGAFWPEAKEVVDRELEKRGGTDGSISGIDSIQSWIRVVEDLSKSSSSSAVLRKKELLKKKIQDILSETEAVGDLLNLGQYFAYSLPAEEWQEEKVILRDRMVAYSHSPQNISDTHYLICYWNRQGSDTEKRVYIEQLEEKFDTFLKNLSDPDDWSCAAAYEYLRKYTPAKESRIELLRKKLRAILYSSNSLGNLRWLCNPSAVASGIFRKTFPDIDHILSIGDPCERRNYLEEHYPAESCCTSEDMKQLKELHG